MKNKLTSVQTSEVISNNMRFNYILLEDHSYFIESYIKNLHLPVRFNIEHFHFCITGPDKKHMEFVDADNLRARGNQIYKIYDQIQDILNENNYAGNHFLIKVDNSKKIGVIFSPLENPLCPPLDIAKKIHAIKPYVEKKYYRYLATSLVTNYEGYGNIHKAYKDADNLNKFIFFHFFDQIITPEIMTNLCIPCTFYAINQNVNRWLDAFCNGNINEVNADIDYLFLELIANSYDYLQFSSAYSLCKSHIDLFIQVYKLSPDSSEIKRIDAYDAIEDYVSDLKLTVKNIMSQIHTFFTPRVFFALGYIQNNYMHDISLSSIADYLHIYPTTISSEFNKEVLCSVSEYISNCRIQKACDLLKRSSFSIEMIAKKVGFTSERYFSHIFKEKMGCAPSQYRRHKYADK